MNRIEQLFKEVDRLHRRLDAAGIPDCHDDDDDDAAEYLDDDAPAGDEDGVPRAPFMPVAVAVALRDAATGEYWYPRGGVWVKDERPPR